MFHHQSTQHLDVECQNGRTQVHALTLVVVGLPCDSLSYPRFSPSQPQHSHHASSISPRYAPVIVTMSSQPSHVISYSMYLLLGLPLMRFTCKASYHMVRSQALLFGGRTHGWLAPYICRAMQGVLRCSAVIYHIQSSKVQLISRPDISH